MHEDIDGMTGEGNFRRDNKYSEVTFNGAKGEFFFRDKDAEKDEATGKYPKENLGQSLEVVVLKIRRMLQEKYRPNAQLYRTTEHNVKGDRVLLYKGKDRAGVVTADKELAMTNRMYTHQVVYCYSPVKREVVRLIVKGASLGSEKTSKGVLKFYDYIQSFKEGEHLRDFMTKLVPVPEEGPNGSYYAIDFQRGEALDDAKKEKVIGLIKEVHESIQRADAKLNLAGQAASTPPDEEIVVPEDEAEEDGFKYPSEEINPEDIPF